jgi:hypothetical protein
MAKPRRACHLPKMGTTIMTQYNSVSGVRFGLQIATAALLYAAARYKKVDGLTSAASRIGIAAVVQGVSQKVRSPLGERSKLNWLADGISLGLVAYGMSYTDLAKRTKYLVGGAIFGSQLVISNLKPNTALARIAKIETKEDCAEVYAELTKLLNENYETIPPEQGARTCKAFFQKARPFVSGPWEDSPASKILVFYSGFLNGLEGIEKAKAYIAYVEFLDQNQIGISEVIDRTIFEIIETLDESERAIVDAWVDKTRLFIQLRRSIQSKEGMEKAEDCMYAAERIFKMGIVNRSLMNKLKGEIRESLEPEGQALVDEWFATDGKKIEASRA